MTSTAPPFTVADSEVAAAIARAERRRGMLERLSDIGMAMAEQIGAHSAAAMAAVNEARGGDPGRAFSAVSRAVRMSLALETRIDQQILALRKPAPPAADKPRRAPVTRITAEAEPDSAVPSLGADLDPAASAHRLRVQGAVWEAIYREVESLDQAQLVLDRLDAGLFGGMEWDDVLSGPWQGAVEAICADLGLAPDWTLWSDEVGFAPNEPGRRILWTDLCARRPANAKRRAGADPP